MSYDVGVDEQRFVSRAGIKLHHALREFDVDVAGLACADFGCNVGGFTDCLLQQGAAHVYAVDTGYGTLAYKLRQDARVTVMERTNALHADPPADPVDIVVIDMGWTKQFHAIPAALRWLKPNGHIITLIKPHYEANETEQQSMQAGALEPNDAGAVCERVLAELPALGVRVTAHVQSPITGGKSSRKRSAGGTGGAGGGNIEFLALLERT